jgi:hypothetical protein
VNPLAMRYRRLLASLQAGDGNQEEIADHDRYVELSLETLRIERELDLSESRLAVANE